jgi:hypothetical protein
MARDHPVAVAIEQHAGEQARLRSPSASVAQGRLISLLTAIISVKPGILSGDIRR